MTSHHAPRPRSTRTRQCLGVVLAAITVLTTSCGTWEAGDTSGDTLRIGIGTSPDCFDPHISPASQTSSIMRNVYDSLVFEKPDGTFAPWLARNWEISADGTEYTFTLRDDVTFHDGTPFDAEAVKANLDRIVAPATASQFAAKLISPYVGTEVVDARTAIVRLAYPYSPFLRAVASTNLGFHSPASLEENAGALCQGGAVQVGTGPFRATVVSDGEGFLFERNDAYSWAPEGSAHSGPARIRRVDYRILPESSVRLGALTSGQVDFIDQVAPTDIAAIEAGGGAVVHRADPTGIPYTYFFNTERAPFDDERVRLAVARGVDLDSLTRSIFQDRYPPALAPLNPATFGYHADGSTRTHDSEAAGALLEAAGYAMRDSEGFRVRGGERLTVELIYDPMYQKPERITFDTAVQDALRPLGIDMRITPVGNGTYLDVRNAGRYDLVAFAWNGTDPDVLRTIYGSDQQLANGGANGSRVRDAELDELLRTGGISNDPDVRRAVYERVQSLVLERGYGLPAYVAPIVTASSNRVRGLDFGVDILPAVYPATLESE